MQIPQYFISGANTHNNIYNEETIQKKKGNCKNIPGKIFLG